MVTHKIRQKDLRNYEEELRNKERAVSTISKYHHDLQYFFEWRKNKPGVSVNKQTIIDYKAYLTEHYAAESVNSMLAALNGFLVYMGWHECRVKPLKIQVKAYADAKRELTRPEYDRLVRAARKKGDKRLCLLLQTICATGIRVSEVRYIKERSSHMICLDHNGQQIEIAQDDMKWLDDDFFRKMQASLPLNSPRAALAYRVSTKGQIVQDDIPLQKIECRKFCQQQGWRVVEEKYEKGISGSKVSASKRDVIQELKAATERHEFDILLVYMFDRLGRIDEEMPFLLQWFVKHGVQMWSTREGEQRMDSHTDKLTNYIRFWQASGESEKISERVQTRLKQMNSSGLYTGGTVPYGYRAVNKGRENKRGQPVKDLEIDPVEAPIVRKLFEKTAYEGASSYSLAQMLNDTGLKTHAGAKFQSTNILRILRHEGYTGHIITRSARSDYIAELEIIDKTLFQKANDVVSQRCNKNHEARRVAKTAGNKTLLGGIVYCAHCGARMSAFMHRDRYKLKDGRTVVNMKPKYNCFQRGQKQRDCDGQSLYIATKVDEIVLETAKTLFAQIKEQPRDRTIETQIRRHAAEQRQVKTELEKRIRDYQHAVERYEDEVLACLDGHSKFTEEQLSHLLTVSNERLKQAKQEYAQCGMDIQSERETLAQLDTYYNDFQGWAEEFEQASLQRKRMILCQLFDRVEVGKGYKVTCYVRMCYQQFLVENTESRQESVMAG